MDQPLFKQEFRIPSTIEGLKKCLGVVREVKERFELDFETGFSLHTVMVEAVENAIIHGNRGKKDLEVRVLIVVQLKHILIEVEDNGDGFDLNRVLALNKESDIRREGGRGIYFINSLCSSCCTEGAGNILKIELRRQS